ncbi:MAG: hypothetical protein JWN97_748 [Nocardioides sp.]|nr:hypothetical protein [Nocardioides sp.]
MAGRKTRLRSVAPDEQPAKVKPKTLAEAVEGDDYLMILIAQRREVSGGFSVRGERDPRNGAGVDGGRASRPTPTPGGLW